MAAVTFCVVVPETERLDRFLADQLALSRTVAARLIADKHVTRDGRPLRASVQLERGAVVSVELPPEAPPPQSYAPAHRDLTFVYEDEHLAVLDKPAGLVVHPGPGHWDDTLVNVLVERGTALAQGAAEGRPGIVHRLDRDTSGLLLVAKTDLAHRRLTRMIERREVERVYAALAWGHFAKSPVDIEAPITRHPTDRKRMTVLAGGRHAVTHVRVTARFAQTDLLRVTLGTGRTHQIRVHLAHVGHPVGGDREDTFGGRARRRRRGEGFRDYRAPRGRRGEEGPRLHGRRSGGPGVGGWGDAGPPAGAAGHRPDAGAGRRAPRRSTLRGSRYRRAANPHSVFLGRMCEPHCPRLRRRHLHADDDQRHPGAGRLRGGGRSGDGIPGGREVPAAQA